MSLNLRIILSATLVLAIFVTLTAATLERAFSDSAESAQRDSLTSQLYALMAAAEIDVRGQLIMPSNELDALLGLPSSGVGDEGDLMEVLGNLLDNAFKWAEQHIELDAYRKKKQLVIHIRDDGPGMPGEMISALLQRGVRADQSTAGHGIGLSIVKNIVDARQGDLCIMQRPQGGSEVVVTL